MNNVDVNPLKLREIILNIRNPIVLRGFALNWSCFGDGLEEWCKNFDELNDSATRFERISKQDSGEPQWERKRQLVELTATDFLRDHGKDREYWSGLNYKRKHELPEKSLNGIDFSAFGFPQAADDCTLWLSSNGANTPCHYDTYGCNIVVQVFGRKSWLLFPPNAPLTTTRIPYEESSVYCKENFYAPCVDIKNYMEKYKDLVHHIILEPNDVLIVPKHWWHYVETVDISLSVNAWIPLKCDLEKQIEECIVKYLIEKFVKVSTLKTRKYIMNPNQLMAVSTDDELFQILEFLINQTFECNIAAKEKGRVFDYQYLNENEVDALLKDYESFQYVPLMSNKEFENYLKTHSFRHNKDVKIDNNSSPLNFMEDILINSVCSCYIIEAIKSELLIRYKQEHLQRQENM